MLINNPPLVSVIAVCYNHQKYVVETLDSIINQTYSNIQLIIMDDCSSDNSVQVIQQWIDINNIDCVFISHQQNKGLCKTLNEALKYVKGKYYKLIACDDTLNQNFIKITTDVFDKSEMNVGFVFSDMETIDEKSKIIEYSYLYDRINLKTIPKPIDFNHIYEKNIIPAPATLIKTEILATVGYYDESLCFEDLDFYLRILKKYKCEFVNQQLIQYRILNTSQIRSRNYSFEKDLIKVYEKHADFSSKSSNLFKKRLSRFATNRFIDGVEPNFWLRKSLSNQFKLKIFILYIFNIIGFNSMVVKLIKSK